MNPADVVLVAGGLAVSGLLDWFFVGPKKAHAAEQIGNIREVRVTVKGGYAPDLVRVRQASHCEWFSTARKAGMHLAGGLS